MAYNSHPSKQYQETLEQLKVSYRERLKDNVVLMEEALRSGEQTFCKAEQLESMRHIAHTLAGSGATFGYPAITDAARVLNSALRQLIQNPGHPCDWPAMAIMLENLRDACRQALQ